MGNRLAHNLLHDAPHQAIGLGGNDHVIEYNVVHHVCMETDDCGAFYMGRNPSNRGTVIRYNFWHHIGSPRGHGNNAVYFDDGDGGQTVIGNVFFRCGEPAKGSMGAVFCHGGHDNLVVNNIFVECKRAIGASPWNDRRWMAQLRGKTYQTRLLEEVDITKPPFTTRYPQLVGFMEFKPGTPRQNVAERNVMVMCGEAVYGNYVQKDNYVTKTDPGFVDIDRGRFELGPIRRCSASSPASRRSRWRRWDCVPTSCGPVCQRSVGTTTHPSRCLTRGPEGSRGRPRRRLARRPCSRSLVRRPTW
ncbi:right-handed parallel beta-helix repeat-containing protein [PVC group bacterium]|nr:right-handed parallel beta-helix repeat-containing protein [PVC group bacterium]